MVMISILQFVLIISTCLYCIGLLFFFIGLFFPNKKRYKNSCFVSVVIAVRNESENIGRLLKDLTNQTFPSTQYEIVVVNDHSEDDTAEIVQHFVDNYPNVRLLRTSDSSSDLTVKKKALQEGIESSLGEIILTTDGDCRVQPSWIETMVSYFSPEVGMVVGFSQLDQPGGNASLFQKLQSLDFLSLMSGAQGALNLGRPLAASGQNFAYRRQAFDAVGGFSRIGHRISGDDVLLLQLVHKQTRWKIRFAPSSDCFNASPPEQSLKAFLNQRKRWASNGSYQAVLNKPFFLYVLTTFITNFTLLFSIILGFLYPEVRTATALCLLCKGLAEGLLLFKGCHLYRRFDLFPIFPFWFVLQVPYVVFVGILGSLGSFTWKERIHVSNHRRRP
jgi:cellulose synthase/poly-beta-1,6-N-acetylglucosamine synthase-like glycosyltransferase